MRVSIRNGVAAEEYTAEVLGDNTDEYSFSAVIDADGPDLETAFEAVNRETYLVIAGLDDISRQFDEHRFQLAVEKQEYGRDLQDVQQADELLRQHGYDFATRIAVEKSGDTPRDAIESLEGETVYPVLVDMDANRDVAILYQPDGEQRFTPSVRPTPRDGTQDALEREEDLEEILSSLMHR